MGLLEVALDPATVVGRGSGEGDEPGVGPAMAPACLRSRYFSHCSSSLYPSVLLGTHACREVGPHRPVLRHGGYRCEC